MNRDTETLTQSEVCGDVSVIRIQVNEVRTAECAMALRDEMITCVESAPSSKVVVDFGDVGFMGSIGFLTLMHLKRHPNKPEIVLCGLSQNLFEAFAACRLVRTEHSGEGLFETAESADQAINAFAA